MISSDLRGSLSASQTSFKINDDELQSLEDKTHQFTTMLLQTSDHAATLNTQALSSSDIERSKSLIHLETKQKVNIEEIPKDQGVFTKKI